MPHERPAPEEPARNEPLPLDAPRYFRTRALADRAPVPARVRSLRFGTAGWTDRTLIESHGFYPKGARTPEARLRYYASQFTLVEVDATYYALPTPSQSAHWAERTPEGFVFDVKAFASITGHVVELARLPEALRSLMPRELRHESRVRADALPEVMRDACLAHFDDALEPLAAQQKLGAVLLQFPPWFEATRGSVRAIERLRERLARRDLAVEFRHQSWAEPSRWPRVLELLRANRMHSVVVDAPQGHRNSMPVLADVADPRRAVVRFHGRRRETWNASHVGVLARFDYLYEPRELAPWVQTLERLEAQADEVHVVFNNCVRDYAVVDARALAALAISARTDDDGAVDKGDDEGSRSETADGR